MDHHRPVRLHYAWVILAVTCLTVVLTAGVTAVPAVLIHPLEVAFGWDRAAIALAVSINAHLAALPFQPELIVASFHGMPQKYVDAGDPYREHCVATTEALRRRLGLDASKLLLTFQSRFGNDPWLQPYTDKTIEELARKGIKRLAVVTPGFSADCLETLEEIAQENAEIFRHNGGEQFSAIPCLNDSDAGMDVIRQLVLRELQGWI